jgi:hypothetical protein
LNFKKSFTVNRAISGNWNNIQWEGRIKWTAESHAYGGPPIWDPCSSRRAGNLRLFRISVTSLH